MIERLLDVVCCWGGGDGVEELFISEVPWVAVSLQSQGRIVIALLALCGGRETWRHVNDGCRYWIGDRVRY